MGDKTILVGDKEVPQSGAHFTVRPRLGIRTFEEERELGFMGPYDSDELNETTDEYAEDVYQAEGHPNEWADTTDEERLDYEYIRPRKTIYKRRKSKYAQGKSLTIPDTPARSGLSFADSHPDGGLLKPLRKRREDESLEEYLKSEMMFLTRYLIDSYLEVDPLLQWDPSTVDRVEFLCMPKVWKRICRWFELTDDEYIKYFHLDVPSRNQKFPSRFCPTFLLALCCTRIPDPVERDFYRKLYCNATGHNYPLDSVDSNELLRLRPGARMTRELKDRNQSLPAGVGLETFEKAVFDLIAELEVSDDEPQVGFWQWIRIGMGLA